MIEVAQTVKTVLATLGMMAVHGTLLAIAALLLVRFARLRPAWQAAIWLVVLVKFVLPWGPAMPWSLADLLASWRGAPVPVHLPSTFTPVPLPAVEPALAPALGWLALATVWAAGTLVVLGRALRAYLVTARAAHAAAPAPVAAHAILVEIAARLRVRTPRLAVGDAAIGPYVIGLVRPIVVVPPALLEDAALLRAALSHELAHVRRRDAIGRAIQIAAVALFWWLPVVRLASRALELARERACDAWALEAGDVTPPVYARLLVRMAALRVAAAPGLASPRTLDRRVVAVLGTPARARMSIVQRLALLGWIALALGGARTAKAAVVGEVCHYTPELAEAIRQAHPDADLDGDGQLSRDEACDYQAELRQRIADYADPAPISGPASELLAEPLCCNCDGAEGLSSASTAQTNPWDSATCKSEGVDR